MDDPAHRQTGLAPALTQLAQQVAQWPPGPLAPSIEEKVSTCVRDLVGCAIEAAHKPWSQQARAMAAVLPAGSPGSATVIGGAQVSSTGDAAFVNAVMGHGLVREDMHAASISHLGVAVIPAVLALSERAACRGVDFVAAVVAGYETGATIGRAVMTAELARRHRPTGITGPLAAAAAGARLLRLTPNQTAHALALAANMTGGLNEWGLTGGSEMYFHPGLAARSGVTAVLLAQAGAQASVSALDGPSGLLASLGRPRALRQWALFGGDLEIMHVYHKAVAACNFAQTACQVAALLAQDEAIDPAGLERVVIRVPQAAAAYPGCDHCGPFHQDLQAKMSIQFNVAAALLTGGTGDANVDLRGDVRLRHLIERTELVVDEAFTAAFPARQGASVELWRRDGTQRQRQLDDVRHASSPQVHQRFLEAATRQWGAPAAQRLDQLIAAAPRLDDARVIAASLGARGPVLPRQPLGQEALSR